MGLYYGWWAWNGTPTLYFFPPVGGVSENSDSKIGSEIMGTYRGNLIRRGNEQTTTDAHIQRISKARGRNRGHISLNSSEIALFSVISKEIGKMSEDLVLGDYRGIL